MTHMLIDVLVYVQTIVTSLALVFIMLMFLRRVQIKKSVKMFAIVRNITFAIIILGLAYSFKFASHIFGITPPFASMEEIYTGLEIVAAAFLTYALLDTV